MMRIENVERRKKKLGENEWKNIMVETNAAEQVGEDTVRCTESDQESDEVKCMGEGR